MRLIPIAERARANRRMRGAPPASYRVLPDPTVRSDANVPSLGFVVRHRTRAYRRSIHRLTSVAQESFDFHLRATSPLSRSLSFVATLKSTFVCMPRRPDPHRPTKKSPGSVDRSRGFCVPRHQKPHRGGPYLAQPSPASLTPKSLDVRKSAMQLPGAQRVMRRGLTLTHGSVDSARRGFRHADGIPCCLIKPVTRSPLLMGLGFQFDRGSTPAL